MAGSVPRRSVVGSRDDTRFERLMTVGEGTYGTVFQARDLDTGEPVAMKKVRLDNNDKEGFPITSLRELKILNVLSHKNIVHLREVVMSAAWGKNELPSVYFVFEYMDHDLQGLLESPAKAYIDEAICKCYFKQLLEGLAFMHANKIVHRDIKTANILLNNQGVVKICDFGLARPLVDNELRKYTTKVITLWYRPPELLVGLTEYSFEIDVWSAGCIFAEMLEKRALFNAADELNTLQMQIDMLGAPTHETAPKVFEGFTRLSLKPRHSKPEIFDRLAKSNGCGAPLSPGAVQFLLKLLQFEPTKRLSATDALLDNYLWNEQPLPAKPEDVPIFQSSFEYTTRKRRGRTGGAADVEGDDGPAKKKFKPDSKDDSHRGFEMRQGQTIGAPPPATSAVRSEHRPPPYGAQQRPPPSRAEPAYPLPHPGQYRDAPPPYQQRDHPRDERAPRPQEHPRLHDGPPALPPHYPPHQHNNGGPPKMDGPPPLPPPHRGGAYRAPHYAPPPSIAHEAPYIPPRHPPFNDRRDERPPPLPPGTRPPPYQQRH